MVLAIILVISSVVQASSVVTIAPVIDLIIHPDLQGISHPTAVIMQWMKVSGVPVSLVSVMLLFIGAIILKNSIIATSKWMLCSFNNAFVRHLMLDEYRALLGAGWSFFVQQRHGMLSNTIVKETQRVGVTLEVVSDMFASVLSVIFYLGVGLYLSWKLTLVVLGMLMVGLGPFFLVGRYTYRIGKEYTQSNNELFSTVQETLSSAKVIIGYGNQQRSLSDFCKIIPHYMKMVLQFVMIREGSALAFEPFSFLIILSAVFIGIKGFGMNVAELLILLYSFRAISQHGMNIVSRRNEMKNYIPAFEQIEQLRSEALAMAQPSGGDIFTGFRDRIRIGGIHFSYPNGKLAIDGISVDIPKGKMVAVVGRSGSGKTTLIDVLMGFYMPQKGSFVVDGKPFAELDINSWRHKIGYIPQEAALFNMSIKDNLLWANEQATDEDIQRSLEMSYANEFIKELPAGLETVVGEHGVRLSGGQRQRLALARAILRNPELLVLDEATSALDSHSEMLIQESIETLAQTTTIVAIAHRLSTIKRADYIYVLDNGRVIEEGTFGQLISLKDGQFLKAAEIQGVL